MSIQEVEGSPRGALAASRSQAAVLGSARERKEVVGD
jgi:hypothetical protein